MEDARKFFVERINAFREAKESEDVVSSKIMNPDEDPARLIRNGLAVVGFATLEQFLRKRSSEILDVISSSGIPFRDLPKKLQRQSTVRVINALSKRLGRRSDIDKMPHAQKHAKMVGSTLDQNYKLSHLSFGYGRSNLSSGKINDMMKKIGIKNGWDKIDKIAFRISISSPSLKSAYESASTRRHTGAHQADAETEVTDLNSFPRHAMAIALGFDALVSEAARFYRSQNSDFLDDENARTVNASDVDLRFLDPGDGDNWREEAEYNERATRVMRDFEDLLELAEGRVDDRGEVLVIRNRRKIPVDWRIGNLV